MSELNKQESIPYYNQMKTCPVCLKVFTRHRKTPNKQWEQQRYCSRDCAHKFLAADKPPKGWLTMYLE